MGYRRGLGFAALGALVAVGCGSEDSAKSSPRLDAGTGDGSGATGGAGAGGTGASGGTGAAGGAGGAGGATGGGGGVGGTGGAGGLGGSGGTGPVLSLGALVPGVWNDWEATPGVACDPVAADACASCVHTGERILLPLIGATDCTGVSVQDELGVLDWVCDDSGASVVLRSTGLSTGSTLRTLVDLPNGVWFDNKVMVDVSGTALETPSMAFWTNPVAIVNAGLAASESVSGTIYVVNQTSSANWLIDADAVALIFDDTATLTSPVAGGRIVDVAGVNFPWIEGGTFEATNQVQSIHFSGVGCGRVTDASASAGSGECLRVQADSRGVLVARVSVSGCGAEGIEVHNSELVTLRDITSTSATLHGVRLGGFASRTPGHVAENITVDQSGGDGIRLDSCADCTLDGASVTSAGAHGIDVLGQNRSTVSGVVVTGSQGVGLNVSAAVDSSFTDLTISGNGLRTAGGHGIEVTNALDSTFTGVSVTGNAGSGIHLTSGGTQRLTFIDVRAVENRDHGIHLKDGHGHRLRGALTTQNGLDGFQSETGDTHIIDILSYSNGRNGIWLRGAGNSSAARAVAANNGGSGVLSGCSSCGLLDITSVNNGGESGLDRHGVAFVESAARFYALNVAAVNSNGTGLLVDNSPGPDSNHLHNLLVGFAALDGLDLQGVGAYTFSGVLRVVGAAAQACRVVAGGTGVSDVTCAGSGATFSNTINPANSFVGKLGSPVLASTVTDWTTLAASFQIWGLDGGAFPSADNQGACQGADTCSQWDFGLLTADTDLRGVSAAPPTGNDVIVHRTTTLSVATTQADCDAAAVGSVFVTDHCEQTFLIEAVEVPGDGIGNDNNLCESDEECLYSPNTGAYQGDGALSAVAFTPGTITGVVLSQASTNGR